MLQLYLNHLNMTDIKDHLELGRDLKLFMFHENSPGSCFFLPHGKRVYDKILAYFKKEYRRRGYDEVMTPNIFKSDLWVKSGHWDHYKDNMFSFTIKNEEGSGDNNHHTYALKAMNCPSHCLIYKSEVRSYNDLPIRYADFGALHRNEATGALRGLTRVRRFCQDDAHIFCMESQVRDEIVGCIKFLQEFYALCGFEYKMTLSTKPDKFMGDPKAWEKAENNLKDALISCDCPFSINEKDGAFYGPKIDVMLKDSLEREHQCGTIQLDFQLPERFDLKYTNDKQEYERPVIVHRAILGSVERMFAVMLEHFQGNLPLWCSPRQVLIVPIHKDVNEYCFGIRDKLLDKDLFVDVDTSTNRLDYKIRQGEVYKYNHILVVGKREAKNNTINLREGKKNQELTLDEFFGRLFI